MLFLIKNNGKFDKFYNKQEPDLELSPDLQSNKKAGSGSGSAKKCGFKTLITIHHGQKNNAKQKKFQLRKFFQLPKCKQA
jgi:hypothetical protein